MKLCTQPTVWCFVKHILHKSTAGNSAQAQFGHFRKVENFGFIVTSS
jgi:hypothetical protein